MDDDHFSSHPSPSGSYRSPLGSDVGMHDSERSSVGSSAEDSGPVGGGLGLPPRLHATSTQLKDCVRLCIFNTNRTTVDEAWAEMFSILPLETYLSIVKLQRVMNASTHPRIDMWVRGDLGAPLVRHLREMTRGRTPSFVRSLKALGPLKEYRPIVAGRWRMAIWQSWQDRRAENPPGPPKRNNGLATPPGTRLATFNVNGFPSKRQQVIQFLEEERITVVALQETLVSAAQYPVLVPGFITFARPWQEGFRGLAVLVRDYLPCYEIPHGKESTLGYNYLLHVKVPRLPGTSHSLHFVGVYLPSGGSVRRERTAGLLALAHLAEGVLRNEPGAVLVAMGDLNDGMVRVDKFLSSHGLGLSRHSVRGSPWTRFPVRGSLASLDHMLVTPQAAALFVKPRVSRQWAMSDHRPLISALRAHSPAVSGTPRTSVRYDRRGLVRNSFELANDNRWLALLEPEVVDQESLSNLVTSFTGTLCTVTTACGIRQESGFTSSVYLPGRLKRLLKKYRGFSRRVADSLQLQRGSVPDDLLDKYTSARHKFRAGLRKWERREKTKHYARIAEDFLIHDHKNVWSRLRSQIDTRHRGSNSQPVRNRAGVLCVEDSAILDATTEHYRALAQDDPGGVSQDAGRWASVTPDYPRTEAELEGLNEPLSWPEVILAIRGMNRDTAPGKCGMHSNLLKALVSEECLAAVFGLDKVSRPDRVKVALPSSDLPVSPLTPMGKALWKVLDLIWTVEEIPDLYNEVVVTSLLKKGDPELLVNYRGLSLISVSLKIIMVCMVHRLEKQLSDKALKLAQAQSGFRKREEVIAQFLVMAEIVRRRHLNELPTVGIFVDLRKAYDRVPHEALYRILDHRGIRGKFLHLVKAIYRNSKMSVRACGRLSDPFEMLRGVRQGCPLSPLLFIIFLDHILQETTPGERELQVPSCSRKARHQRSIGVAGGLYADDLVCFEGSIADARTQCVKLVEWGEKWGMELNFDKCGVILWSYDAAIRSEYEGAEFLTPQGIVPKVASYKYLGIIVSSDLPVFMGVDARSSVKDGRTDSMLHALSQAEKGLKTLSVLKPILTDRFCPIPLKVELVRSFVFSVMAYGGEFIGFNKKNAVPIQRVMDLACRWIVGLKKSHRLVSSLTLSVELGLPRAYEFLAGLRAQLFHKLTKGIPPMQTYLPELQRDHQFHPYRTWCSETALWLKSYHSVQRPWVDGSHGLSGVNRYAPVALGAKSRDVRKRFVDPITGVFDEDAHEQMCEDVTEWYVRGADGPSPWGTAEKTLQDFEIRRTDAVAPIRCWFSFARVCELHRRSNSYSSPLINDYHKLLLGVDKFGRVLLDPRILPDCLLQSQLDYLGSALSVEEAKSSTFAFHVGFPWIADLQRVLHVEREAQDLLIGGSSPDDGARRLFMREVRECALEHEMDVEGAKSVTFSGWYDVLQFGASRDFLRVSLGRTDLAEGVQWLVLVRSGGFPRSASWRRVNDPLIDASCCPLCGGKLEVGWDWMHLVLQCSHVAVDAAREEYLHPALDYHLTDDRINLAFELWPSVPEVMVGLPYRGFTDGRHPGWYLVMVAIYLAGGVLLDPRESTFVLSYGHLDISLCGLQHFGYVYLASFLQVVSPVYTAALGLPTNRGLGGGLSPPTTASSVSGLDIELPLEDATTGGEGMSSQAATSSGLAPGSPNLATANDV